MATERSPLRFVRADQLERDRAVAAVLVLAVAADADWRALCDRCEELERPCGVGGLHLPAVPRRETALHGRARRAALQPAHQTAAGRHGGEPHAEVVAPCIVALEHTARQKAHRSDAQSLAAPPPRTDAKRAELESCGGHSAEAESAGRRRILRGGNAQAERAARHIDL